MGQTMVEKICQRHLAEGPDRPLRTGDVISLRPRHVMTHDNTAPVIKKFKGIGATKVKDPKQVVFTLDHEIQNTTEENLAKYRADRGLREAARHRLPSGGHGHRPPDHGVARLRRPELAGGGVGLALEHVRRARRLRHAGGAHGRGRHLGHGRVLVADPALHPGHADGQAAGRGDGQGPHHHAVRPVQQGRGAQRRGRVRRARAWRT